MAVTCPVCHQPISEGDMYCPKCGAQSPIYEEFVDGPPEGYVAPDPTNPYAAPQVDNSPVYRIDWIWLARSLKMMNISFFISILYNLGFYAFFVAAADMADGEEHSVVGTIAVFYLIFMIVLQTFFWIGVIRTAGALGCSAFVRILWFFLALYIPLIPALILGIKSKNCLRAAGFRPGFFYPDMKQFEWPQTDPNDPYLDPRGPIQKQ